jgi:hypothetical protein
MELDPGIHIGNTWFVLKTGCDRCFPLFSTYHECLKLTFLSFVLLQLIQEETRGKGAEIPESSSEDEEEDATEKEDGNTSGGDEDGGSGSDNDDDGGAEDNSEQDDSSPKIDITG